LYGEFINLLWWGSACQSQEKCILFFLINLFFFIYIWNLQSFFSFFLSFFFNFLILSIKKKKKKKKPWELGEESPHLGSLSNNKKWHRMIHKINHVTEKDKTSNAEIFEQLHI
jgi:hypothetical protein